MSAKIRLCTFDPNLEASSTLFKKVSEASHTTSVESIHEFSVEINPASANFGQVVKKDFAFVPLKSLTFSFEAFKGAFGESGVTSPDNVFTFLKDSYKNLVFTLLSETEDEVTIAVSQSREGEKDSQKLLEEIIGYVGQELEYNYCRYFVTNCLISDAGKTFNGDKDAEKKLKEALNKFIEENIQPKQVEKTEFQNYTESFDFRPFFGEGLEKLPKYKKDADTWNWDELYINPGMDSEAFRPAKNA